MTPRLNLPDRDYLLQCFDYNADNGTLTWKRRPLAHFRHGRAQKAFNSRWAGKQAGAITVLPTGQRYMVVSLDSRIYRISRVVMKMALDIEPPIVDHLDCDPTNNRLKNLRPSNHAQNMWNRKAFKNNKTGLKGVSFCPQRKGYVASIKANGVQTLAGPFSTAEAAHEVYRQMAIDLHGEFARTE